MRFIHTADIHLGASPEAGKAYSAGRADEIWDTFAKLIEVARQEKTDLLLIAGDLFHREPLLRELKEVSYLFDQIPDTRVVFVAGNHDYIRKNSAYLRFEWGENVHPILEDEATDITFPDLEVTVRGLSYHSREITEPLLQNQPAPDDTKYTILLLHGGDEKHIPIDKNRLESLGYDYIAMGHIHRPHAVIPGYAAYSGSLEPTDILDLGQHGYISGEITKDVVEVKFVPFASRKYIQKEIEITSENSEYEIADYIAEMIRKCGAENMYELILTGFTDPDVELYPELWDPYGNIISITNHTRRELDYEKLYRKNRGNLMGHFLESFHTIETDCFEEEIREAGTLALLHAMKD